MLIYNVVSAICLLIMISIVLTVLVKIIVLKRPDKIQYVRNFKKGKCAVIYLVAIPLFFLNNLYAGKPVFESVLDGISKSIYLIAMKYDTSNVSALASVCPIFKVAVYLCLSLIVVNAIMLTLSLFHQFFWEFFKRASFRAGKTDKCIIIGNNQAGLTLYKTCGTDKIVYDELTTQDEEKLYVKNVVYKSFVKGASIFSWFSSDVDRLVKKLYGTNKKVNVIITLSNEKSKLNVCGQFVKYVSTLDESLLKHIAVYVYGDREYEDIYSKYEKSARGCLHYVNEYRQIAIDFIDKYPLTEYMNESHIDYDTSLLKSNVEVSVAMIGFGRTNQQVFLSMVANNQFLKSDGKGGVVTSPVKYHFFDKVHTKGHKNLNHNYFRFKHNFYDDNGNLVINQDDYLEMPQSPSHEEYHAFDINEKSFYEDLGAVIRGENKYGYVIVSLGEDYLSIDVANKLVAKITEWQLKNCHVFVRVRDKGVLKDSKIFLNEALCTPFGTDDEVAYDYSHAIFEKFSEMAIMQNYVYDIERNIKKGGVTANEMEKSRIRWYVEKTALERESNSYACLSIRNKLHLMGLDYVLKSEPTCAISEEEYLSVYARGDMPNFVYENGEKIAVNYGINFKKSRRYNMACQEHARWNAYMIMQGFIPATIEQTLNARIGDKYTNGKSYELRYHSNLTTMNGLIEFRKLIASRDGVSEDKTDVIKYDYQLLDGVYWLLDQNGYKIVKR